LALVYACAAGDRSQASALEYQVKQLTRQRKLQLVAEQPVSLAAWLTAVD
jgi:putative endonuclease